jgi:hypothetical protein
VRRQPRDQPVERRVLARARRRPLLRPARDLAREVVAGPAVVGEPDRGDVDAMQAGERARHRRVHRATIRGLDARQRVRREHAPVDLVHHVERRADDLAPGMEQQRARHRHVGARERAQHAVLAVDRVRGGQEVARRLLAQHHRAIVVVDDERRVGLAAADAREAHLAGEPGQRAAQERVEPRRVEAGRARDLGGAHALADRFGRSRRFQSKNASASSARWRAITIRCTSEAPSTSRAWRA